MPEVRLVFWGLQWAVGVSRGTAHKCGGGCKGTAVREGRKWARETSSLCSKEGISLLKDAIGNLGVLPYGLEKKDKLPRLVLRKQCKSVSMECLRERPL